MLCHAWKNSSAGGAVSAAIGPGEERAKRVPKSRAASTTAPQDEPGKIVGASTDCISQAYDRGLDGSLATVSAGEIIDSGLSAVFDGAWWS